MLSGLVKMEVPSPGARCIVLPRPLLVCAGPRRPVKHHPLRAAQGPGYRLLGHVS